MGLKRNFSLKPSITSSKTPEFTVFSEVYFLSTSVISLNADTDHVFTHQWLITPTEWWKTFFTKTYLSSINDLIIVDGMGYLNNTTQSIVFISATSNFYHLTTNYYTILSDNLKLTSITNLRRSTNWLEREIAEFSTLTFTNLVDTRRLLTDYITPKNFPQTHLSEDRLYTYNVSEIVFAL